MIPQPQLSTGYFLPAPVRGINGVDSLGMMDPSDAIYAYNMTPTQYGLKVRQGYQQWATAIPGAGGVRTIISVKGGNIDGSQDKLLVSTPAGIYNCSTSVNAPSVMEAWATTTGLAGWGTWTYFVTTAGQYIALCDEANGYKYMDVATGTWTTPIAGGGAGEISGATPGNFDFVVAHKARLWFIQRNSAIAWFLPVGQLTGTVTRFDFGNKFARGGYLVGLYTFTHDGGAGPDDYLVAIGSAGDVIVYAGTDPTDATRWNLVGNWFVGEMPVGRRVVGSFGSDLIILSIYGALYLSKLMSGADVADPNSYVTKRISPLINYDMASLRTSRGWEVQAFPRDNLLVILTPTPTNGVPRQYVLNLSTGGWAIYRGMPSQTARVHNGDVYFGSSSSILYKHLGPYDDAERSTGLGGPVEFSILSSYQGVGNPSQQKMVDFIRPHFMSALPPSFEVMARFDYDISEAGGAVSFTGSLGSVWDAALWDAGIWTGFLSPSRSVRGASGIGTKLAIALRGSCLGDTILVGFDVSARQGGFM